MHGLPSSRIGIIVVPALIVLVNDYPLYIVNPTCFIMFTQAKVTDMEAKRCSEPTKRTWRSLKYVRRQVQTVKYPIFLFN